MSMCISLSTQTILVYRKKPVEIHTRNGSICHIQQPDDLYFTNILFGHMLGLYLIIDMELSQSSRKEIKVDREHLLYPDSHMVVICFMAYCL